MSKEIFKNIPGYVGIYQVSNLGNVKSFKFGKERILKPGINSSGYMMVQLSIVKQKAYKVASLVAMAFLDHEPDGHKIVVDHINNVKTDDRLENLQLLTSRENLSKDKKGTSKYTGVCWNKERCKWSAYIYLNGKSKHLGVYISEFEASEAYQNELKKQIPYDQL